MADPRFFVRAGPFTLGELAEATNSDLGPRASPDYLVRDVSALDAVAPGAICFAQGRNSLDTICAGDRAAAVIIKPGDMREGTPDAALLSANPARTFALIAAKFYPADRQPQFASGSFIDPTASIGQAVVLGPGVAVGASAEIGDSTIIAPNAVIGPGVRIGRQCRIGANAVIAFALIGDRVVIHPAAAIGQDGFGYHGSSGGYLKIPQLGRVIIQDDVEIGAGSTIDRGALGDTMIGEGTKIDNLVHVAHNCRVGRYVALAGQIGLSGSVTIGDFAILGGQVGVADHLTIGDGARIGAKAGVMSDVPAGGVYAGFPARRRFQWLREVAWLEKTVKKKSAPKGDRSDRDREDT